MLAADIWAGFLIYRETAEHDADAAKTLASFSFLGFISLGYYMSSLFSRRHFWLSAIFGDGMPV